jgi:cysteine desulfurase
MQPLYLDCAATTPIDPLVRAAMRPFLEEEFGNPSSRHPPGQQAADAVDEARRRVARALGARAAGIVFASGGTEANNLAVLGLARERRSRGRHVLYGPTEHPSVRLAARALEEEGFEVEEIPLAADGSYDLDAAARMLRADTVLVGQMLVSNELGNIYPVRELVRLARGRSPEAAVHVDAVQAFGKLDLSQAELGCDTLAISAHKVHGPKGIGALAIADGVTLRPMLYGGSQEHGLRAGTENVAGIVGLGHAASLADERREETVAQCTSARTALVEALGDVPGIDVLLPGGADAPRAPHVVSLRVTGPPSEVWMHHLETHGVYVSAGSACNSKSKAVSPTLLALGLDADGARRVLRVSFSHGSRAEDGRRAAETLAAVGRELEALLR